MISSKTDLREYLEADKRALSRTKAYPAINDYIWKYEILLRKCEYYHNLEEKTIIKKLWGG